MTQKRKWRIQEVPGYEVEWYVVYELRGTKLEILDYENIERDKVDMLLDVATSIFHDLKSISERELKGLPVEKKQLDVVVKAKEGYISMSFIADSMLVMAGLKKKE